MPSALDLVLAPDLDAFVGAARPLLDAPEELDRLVPGLLAETALRHWRESYPKHVPHALLALLGGLEARDLLDGPERTRPVLQALFYVSREKHLPRFDPESVPARGGARELARALADGDFETAYAATRALLAAGAAERVREVLLADATRDGFNLFHRFIYPAKVFRRLRAEPDLPAEALLYPVVHYATTAPRDDHHRRGVEAAGGPGDGDPAARAEAVIAAAADRMPAARDYDWVPLAHVITFAEAARDWWLTGESAERAYGPALAESFFAEVTAETPPPGLAPVPRGNGLAPAEEAAALATAIADRDSAAAGAAAAALATDPDRLPLLGRTILVAGAAIDGGLAFSHDVKVAADAVRLARDGVECARTRVLPRVAEFLAALPPGARLAHALWPPGSG